MQDDFHYYATYTAAYLAGFSHEESQVIGYCSRLTDWCSMAFLKSIGAPISAATTQLQLELMDIKTDYIGIQVITRIWSSFHFLPYDLHAEVEGSKQYRNKYRLLCNVNGDLLVDTVNLAKDKGLQAAGLSMHILADTWAHRYFAGTPSRVINNVNYHFFELIPEDGGFRERKVKFNHSPGGKDDAVEGHFANTISSGAENTIMCLGHGRAGHLPDYSYIRYKYMPSWGNYREIVKDNPSDYYHALAQMVYGLKFLRGDAAEFRKETYDFEALKPYEEEITEILTKRQIYAEEEWKAFAEKLSGQEIEAFNLDKYKDEFVNTPENERHKTFLGSYFLAAMSQKSMITHKIYESGNSLAGVSVDYNEKGFKGIRDYRRLVERDKGGDEA